MNPGIESFKDSLSKKVGPLPMGAWIALASAGVSVAIVLARRNDAPVGDGAAGEEIESDAQTATATAPLPTTPTGFVVGGYPGPGATGQDVNPNDVMEDVDTSNGADFNTNSEWGIAAVRLLIARGVAGGMAQDAIGRFLSGATLTAQANAIIDTVLAALGPPPIAPPVAQQPPSPTPTPSTPAAPTPPKPPKPPATTTRKAPNYGFGGSDIRDGAKALGGKAGANKNRVYFVGLPGVPFWAYVNAAAGKRATPANLEAIAKNNGSTRENVASVGRRFSVPKEF